MSEQPTHAMLVRADDGSLHHRPACTSRKCAERTINFAEGGQVVGVTYLYPEPVPGVQFWSAVQLGKAPKTVAEPSSAWRPIAEAPRDGTYVLITDRRHPPCYLIAKWRHGKWWSAPTKSGHSITWDEATDFMPLPTPPQDDQP